MFVLGVDPGLSRCGYGVIERPEGSSAIVARAAGVIETAPTEPLPQRLATVHLELGDLITQFDPDAVVVERVFFQTNVRTAMSVGQVSGLALAAAAAAGCVVVEYTANEVKQAVVGYGSATPPSPPDVADALALAICHVTTMPLRAAVAAASAGALGTGGTP